MMQVIELSDDEKRVMYSRCTKQELISMLIEKERIEKERRDLEYPSSKEKVITTFNSGYLDKPNYHSNSDY